MQFIAGHFVQVTIFLGICSWVRWVGPHLLRMLFASKVRR
jgi:hypothetical protein